MNMNDHNKPGVEMFDKDDVTMEMMCGEIWVNEFDEKSAQKFRMQLKKRAQEDPAGPIIIYIDSYGGNADALAKMIGTMNEVSNAKVTVCMGKAMSAAAILLSHGDFRYCEKNSRIMVHEVSSITMGDVHDMTNDAGETQRLNRHFMDLLAKNCCIKGGYDGLRKILKGRDGREMYLDAEGAKKFGLIDTVGVPAIGNAVFFEISTAQDHQKKHLPPEEIKKLLSKKSQVEKIISKRLKSKTSKIISKKVKTDE